MHLQKVKQSSQMAKHLYPSEGVLKRVPFRVQKFDIQIANEVRLRGVVFLTGTRQYMWYIVCLLKTCNAVDRTFCDAIKYTG